MLVCDRVWKLLHVDLEKELVKGQMTKKLMPEDWDKQRDWKWK